MNIYVGNLPYTITFESEDAEILSQLIIQNLQQVLIQDYSNEAIKALNESNLKGRNIRVNQAKPRGERSQRGPRY